MPNELLAPQNLLDVATLAAVTATPFIPLGGVLPDIYEISTDQLRLGSGFDSATARQKAPAIGLSGDDSMDLKTVLDLAGSNYSLFSYEARSMEDIRSRVGVQAAASFNWGIYAGDASLSFVRSGETSSIARYVQIDYTIRRSTQILRTAKLRQEVEDAVADGTLLEKYGDQYAYGFVTGGHLSIVLEMKVVTSNERQILDTAIAASLEGLGNGQAAFSAAMSALRENSVVTLHVLRAGGLTKALPTIDTIVQAVDDFPALVEANPVVIKTLVRGYDTVDNPPSGLPSIATLRRRRRNVRDLAIWLDAAYRTRNDLEFAKSHQDQVVDPATLDVKLQITEETINELTQTADAVAADPSVQVLPPSELPIVVFEGPVVGPGGWVPVTLNAGPNYNPGAMTSVGIVPISEGRTLEFKGSWTPNAQDGVTCYDASGNPLDPARDYKPYPPQIARYCAFAEIRPIGGTKPLLTLPYDGTPIVIPYQNVEVRVYPNLERWDLCAPCTPPLQARLVPI